ncbi:hypothetical protein D918_03678 [Trichuris suis]|nr:hypothetical protein D918_03678 [Trichuris suis]
MSSALSQRCRLFYQKLMQTFLTGAATRKDPKSADTKVFSAARFYGNRERRSFNPLIAGNVSTSNAQPFRFMYRPSLNIKVKNTSSFCKKL